MHVTKERIGLVAGAAMLITNPLTSQYIIQAVDWALVEVTRVGAYVGIVATVYLMGLMLYYYHRANKVKIPTKSTKTLKSKFIET